MRSRILAAMSAVFAIMMLSVALADSGLQASLADPAWDGKTIPPGQQCHRFGGEASTPRLKVSDIPQGTQALVLAFSDRDYPPMNHGGHGQIGYRLPTRVKQTIVPSVPGHTFTLPPGFFLIKAHANPKWDKPGAYMPPCSGGKGHEYYVTVQAVTLNAYGKPDKVLGQTVVEMGRY
ncbi:MAG: hypothetical protein P8Y64_05535 [Gammaproteobacteria bacterium]